MDANITMGRENYAKFKLQVHVPTDATADFAIYSTLATFILTHGESKPKI